MFREWTPRFSLSSVLAIFLIASVGLGWYIDRSALVGQRNRVIVKYLRLVELIRLTEAITEELTWNLSKTSPKKKVFNYPPRNP